MLRCYICGREGTRQFRHMPKSTVAIPERFGGGETVVGGFDECSNKRACRRRSAEQSRRAGYHPEGEYP